tara:strand:- start:155982 stop:156131 length:150 start_codon:yes stop_codon:yes gene_type:complete
LQRKLATKSFLPYKYQAKYSYVNLFGMIFKCFVKKIVYAPQIEKRKIFK